MSDSVVPRPGRLLQQNHFAKHQEEVLALSQLLLQNRRIFLGVVQIAQTLIEDIEFVADVRERFEQRRGRLIEGSQPLIASHEELADSRHRAHRQQIGEVVVGVLVALSPEEVLRNRLILQIRITFQQKTQCVVR